MKKNNKGRPSAIITQQRRKRVVELTKAGVKQADIARDLSITPVAVCLALKELRKTMSEETQANFEDYRKAQLAILEQIESALLENKVSPEVAREWRQIRGDIATLLGLNAPHRTLSIKTEIGNEQTKGFYVRFAKATMKLKHPESWQRLWDFIESMPSDYEVSNVPRLSAPNTEETR
jgi:predicted transcriptional regulator